MENLEKYILEHRTAFDTELPSLKVWARVEKHLDTEGGMESQFERFIEDNRAQFDTEIPNLKVWAAVDKHINRAAERRLVLVRWAQRAAAAIVLLVVGAGIGVFANEKREAIEITQQVEEVVPNFKETEKFYNAKVKAQLSKLASYDQQDPSVLSDLEQIDAVQQELRAELELAPSSTKEDIVRRMIDNYQFKLEILERVLRPIEADNFEKEENADNLNEKNKRVKKGQKHETI
jgi:hypothetical protein